MLEKRKRYIALASEKRKEVCNKESTVEINGRGEGNKQSSIYISLLIFKSKKWLHIFYVFKSFLICKDIILYVMVQTDFFPVLIC